jgi:hypothetical protein
MIHERALGTLRESLEAVLTTAEPLGPTATEELLDHEEAFLALYDQRPGLVRYGPSRRASYILGRKGAGKTAFLLGESLRDGHDVVSVKAHNAFSVMAGVRASWESTRGPLPLDHMVRLWEALLVHAAMRGLLSFHQPGRAASLNVVNSYITGLVGDIEATKESQFIFALGTRFSEVIAATDVMMPADDILAQLTGGGVTYAQARAQLDELLQDPKQPPLDVVVDNLEDLHMQVDGLAPVLAGLFRIIARLGDASDTMRLPFELRFAFPAEMLRKLRTITANPEKDFKNHITLNWTAKSLIDLAGRRLGESLKLRFDVDDNRIEGLDAELDGPPEEILRAVLPKGKFLDGLGIEEDPLGYVLRHTQLLPRHLIQLLNSIIRPIVSGPHFRRVEGQEVLDGVRQEEDVIVEGVLSSYLYEYPTVGVGLERLQNRLRFTFTSSELQQAFNQAGVRRATGERFEDFQWAALGIGAFGIVRPAGTDRYVVADFSYIEGGQQLQPIEGDRLCIHPLFVHRLFDRRGLEWLRSLGEKPVYPYGILPGSLG